jgi:hypothetical protein
MDAGEPCFVQSARGRDAPGAIQYARGDGSGGEFEGTCRDVGGM